MRRDINHISSIDLLRGLAAISVSLFHFVIISKLVFPSIFRDVFSYGHLGVQIFFVVSGFVIPYSMHKGNYNLKKIKVFFLKRIVRLEPPYILSILLVLLLNFLFFLSPYYKEDILDVSWYQLLYHIGYLNSIFQEKWINDVYWSLGIEFQYYILLSIVYEYVSNKTTTWFILVIIFTFSSFLIPQHSFIFFHLPFFIIGISIFRLLIEKDSFYFFILCLIFMLIVIYFQPDSNIFFSLSALVTLPFFLFFKRSFKIGKFLGNISYSLYLIHIPVGQRFILIGANYTSSLMGETFLILLALSLSILVSYFFYLFIEKPSKEIAKRYKY
jgi:peptidoglycan/LPS O-acetylase OafA/YrhL